MKMSDWLFKHNFSQQTIKQIETTNQYEKVNNFFNFTYDWSHTDRSNGFILIASKKFFKGW